MHTLSFSSNLRLRRRDSMLDNGLSLFVGDPPSTYSTILTPRPPVESRGLFNEMQNIKIKQLIIDGILTWVWIKIIFFPQFFFLFREIQKFSIRIYKFYMFVTIENNTGISIAYRQKHLYI